MTGFIFKDWWTRGQKRIQYLQLLERVLFMDKIMAGGSCDKGKMQRVRRIHGWGGISPDNEIFRYVLSAKAKPVGGKGKIF